MAQGDLKVDYTKLESYVLTAYQAAKEKRGIFRKGFQPFLPQDNLPAELENKPKTSTPKNAKLAAQYLFLMASLERKQLSRINIRNAYKVWAQPEKHWIFDQEEVVRRDVKEIQQVIEKDFRYSFHDFPENYANNSKILVEKYGGDPRKIVDNRCVAKAREELMQFKGIGTGIANLYIIYLSDREIAHPIDRENMLLKVDVHKARLSLNTEAVTTKEEYVRRDQLVPLLERAYWEITRKNDLDARFLDNTLWIIGSEGCAKKSYRRCLTDCPLANTLCTANIPEDEELGKFILYKDGKRNDSRRGIHQNYFDFFNHELLI